MLHYKKEKNMKKPGYFWLELGIHAYLTIFQWITGQRSAKSKNRISYVLPCFTPLHENRGFWSTLHTRYRDIPKTNRMLDLRMRTTTPFGGNIDRVGNGYHWHHTRVVEKGGYFSMNVVGNSWCLKDLQYHNVSHEQYPCPISSDWFVDRYSVSIG